MRPTISTTIFIFFLLGRLSTISGQPLLHWEHNYNSIGSSSDVASDIIVDNDGYAYVVGYRERPGTGKDCVVLKYSPDGDTVWTRIYDRPGVSLNDEGISITLDAEKNVYVCGSSQMNSDRHDLLAIKYDSNGVEKWITIYVDPMGTNERNDAGLDLVLDASGNVIIGGRIRNRSAVLKLDNSGQIFPGWSGPTIDDTPDKYEMRKVGIHPLNNRIIAMETDQPNHNLTAWINEFDPNTGDRLEIHQSLTNTSSYEGIDFIFDVNGGIYELVTLTNNRVWTGKYISGEFNPIWTHKEISNNDGFSGVGIDQDDQGNLYVLSQFYDEDISLAHLRKISPQGDSVYARKYYYPGGIDYIPVSISTIKSGIHAGTYICGYTATGNIVLLKYDFDGTFQWDVSYDCLNGPDLARKMFIDLARNIFVTGYSICENTDKDIKTLKYCLSAPQIPDSIDGYSTVCRGSVQTYTVQLDSLVEYYSWTLPFGWTSNQSDSNSIQVIVSDSAVSGTLTVVAHGNSCSSPPRFFSANVLDVPETPIFTVGESVVCSGSNQIYAVDVGDNVELYEWDLPQSWIGASDTDSILATTGVSGGLISVTASNSCGLATAEFNVNVVPTPAQAIILGDTTACNGNLVNITTENPDSSLSYLWIIPQGWSSGPINQPEVIVIVGEQSGYISLVTTIDTLNLTCYSDTAKHFVEIIPSPSTPQILGPSEVCLGANVTFTVNKHNLSDSLHWIVPLKWTILETTANSITALPDSSGSIQVLAVNICDSSEVATANVSVVNTSPLIGADIVGPTCVISGSTVTYFIDSILGASSYEWIVPNEWIGIGLQNDSATFFIEMATNASIAVIASNACGDTFTNNLAIFSNNIDSIPLIVDALGCSINAPAGYLTYEWHPCGSDSLLSDLMTFTPNTDGIYSVSVMDNNGCLAQSECVSIECITSTLNISSRKIQVYPNPVAHQLQLSSEDLLHSISIWNSLGQEVLESQAYCLTSCYIDVADLKPGVYFVIAFTEDNERICFRIIKS